MEHEYLENIEQSAEYRFVQNGLSLAKNTLTDISYFDGANLIGQSMFCEHWTGREFFSRRGNTVVLLFKMSLKSSYRLFRNDDEEDMAYRMYAIAENQFLLHLKNGDIPASYHDPVAGESVSIPPSFWGSNKRNLAITMGRVKDPSGKRDYPRPGFGLIIMVNETSVKKICKKLLKESPNNPNKRKIAKPASEKDFLSAMQIITTFCKSNGLSMRRDIFYDALNHVLSTKYYNDGNSRSTWEEIAKDYNPGRGKPRKDQPTIYLSVPDLPKFNT